jgi:hypothetical protein
VKKMKLRSSRWRKRTMRDERRPEGVEAVRDIISRSGVECMGLKGQAFHSVH